MFATVVRRRSVIQRMHMFMRFLHVVQFFLRMADQSIITVMTGIRQNRCHGLQRQRHSQEAGEEET